MTAPALHLVTAADVALVDQLFADCRPQPRHHAAAEALLSLPVGEVTAASVASVLAGFARPQACNAGSGDRGVSIRGGRPLHAVPETVPGSDPFISLLAAELESHGAGPRAVADYLPPRLAFQLRAAMPGHPALRSSRPPLRLVPAPPSRSGQAS